MRGSLLILCVLLGWPGYAAAASADSCPHPQLLLREAQTATRLADVFLDHGMPELARTLLRASRQRLAVCTPAPLPPECPDALGRARDDVALAYSLGARGQERALRDVLQRAAAALLDYSASLEPAERPYILALHQEITQGFSAPFSALPDDVVLRWWDRLERWCVASEATAPRASRRAPAHASPSAAGGRRATKRAPAGDEATIDPPCDTDSARSIARSRPLPGCD